VRRRTRARVGGRTEQLASEALEVALDQALLDLTRGIGKLTLTREVLMGKCEGRQSTQRESTGAIEAMLGELGTAGSTNSRTESVMGAWESCEMGETALA
jgi:hypothetical protein